MSYHGLGFTASATLSPSGLQYSSSGASGGSGGGSIDWANVCISHKGDKAKKYISDNEYSFTCNDGFGCSKKPGTASKCGYSSSGSAPPPPPSAPTSYMTVSQKTPYNTNIIGSFQPATSGKLFLPGMTVSPKTGIFVPPSQDIVSSRSDISPPVTPVVAPDAPWYEDKTKLVAASVGALAVVAAAVYFATRRN